ncbi:vWA domain-containing protein [Deinococcus hohokamensis]|uniref:VWA domain-containing protein n=1 Tax=Deinococcus hohokamensis TaxID=309883 RepID=A0ABV9IC64_9DEIO
MRTHSFLAVLSAGVLLAACGPSTPVQAPPPAQPSATSGTVNGVRVLNATTYQVGFTPLSGSDIVTTATLSSASITDLSAGQATASICGQVQGQDVITTSISLDSTGSMASTDPQELRRTAAQAFVSRMSDKDRAAVLSFDTGTDPTDGLLASRQWQTFTSDKTLLNAAINQATFTGSGTPLFDAIVDGSAVVTQSGGSNRKVLVLTDGEDNASNNSAQDAIDAANKNGTPVYAIGLDDSGSLDFTELEDIAARTGGLFQKAGDAAQLQTFFDRMYNALRAQGCVQVNFTQKPATGTTVTGILNVTVEVSGKAPATLKAPFSFDVR